MRKVILLTLIALAGCANVNNNPLNQLAALDNGMAASETLALGYESLPVCGPNTTAVCQSPEVVATLKAVYKQALADFTAARQQLLTAPPGSPAIQTAIAAMQAALTTLQNYLVAHGIKGA